MSVVDDLLEARDAFDRRDWVAAYEGMTATDDDALSAADFAQLATAAYLLGHRNDCVQALQRAYRHHVDAAETAPAVRCAFWLAKVLVAGGEMAVAGGWVARAQRLLDERGSDDLVERGYVLVHLMFQRIGTGDFSGALELADEIEKYGRRFDDPDLLAVGLSARGRLLMYAGRVPEGLTLLDEAMVGVAAGDVSPILAGDTYCALIEACQEIADFARAAEWTTRLTRWCESQPGLVPFTGQCAVHRGQIMKVRGALDEALDEFDGALERYRADGSSSASGLAWAERGDVLRIRGDLTDAEAAFERAVGYGHDPQPGLALVWLDQGRVTTAATAVRRVLSEPRNPVQRARLLPAATDVLVAEGALDEAAATAGELAELADRFGIVSVRASASFALGAVALARGEPAAAASAARDALGVWARLEAPFDTARARVLLGRAYLGLGDEDSAHAELDVARREFTRLGATPSAHAVEHLLAPSTPGGLTPREVEVLRLVAAGASNPAIAEQLVLSEKTVARHLSNIFAKLDVRSRTAAAAYAFEHDLVRRD